MQQHCIFKILGVSRHHAFHPCCWDREEHVSTKLGNSPRGGGALGGPGRTMAGVKSKVSRVLDRERNMKQSINTPAEFKYSFLHLRMFL